MMPSVRTGLRALPTCGLAALLAFGCVKRTVEPVSSGPATTGIAPQLVIEQFLRAANANDLQQMGRLFGTADGSVLQRDPRSEVEKRMFAIASLLRHQDYTIQGQSIVPGRDDEIRLAVRLKREKDEVVVPFTLVRTHDGGWLITDIDLTAVTSKP